MFCSSSLLNVMAKCGGTRWEVVLANNIRDWKIQIGSWTEWAFESQRGLCSLGVSSSLNKKDVLAFSPR